MSADELMSKAVRAVASARLLLDAGDTDGTRPHAEALVEQAAGFVRAMQGAFLPGFRDPNPHGGLFA